MTGPTPAPTPSGSWSAPTTPPDRRVYDAYRRRGETDYFFQNIGVVIFLTIITCGIYGLFVFYQLMRRMRDHNRRRIELLQGATDFAWEQISRRGLGDDARPAFERISSHLTALQTLSTEFRDPAVWLVIVVAAGIVTSGALAFVPWMIGLVLLDGDLVRHDQHEGAVEAELSQIYEQLGHPIPPPDPSRMKGPQNYAGRIVATIFTCTVYGYWWMANAMADGNRHFTANWPWEDGLAASVQALLSADPDGNS